MIYMFDFDKDKIKNIVLMVILLVSSFKLFLLLFPTMTYILMILGIVIPLYFLHKKKKEEDE